MIEAALILCLASPPPAVAASEPQTPAVRTIDAVIIDANAPDLVELEAAVRLRLGDVAVSRSDRARKARETELFAYLEIVPDADGRVTLRLTLGDARAWVRPIEAPAEDRTREIATMVGNLVAGIEVDGITPDLRDVPLPPPLQPVAPPPPKPVPTKPALLPPVFEWSLGLDGGVLLAVGPPPPAGLAGGLVAARTTIRWWRSGALLTAAIRGAFDRARGYGMTRVRADVGGGYALYRGGFALHTTVAATIEPWFVTRGGAIGDGTPRPIGALAGGELRIAPMWRKPIGKRTLLLGPFVTAGGSGLVTSGGGVARLRSADDARVDLFRAGGLELGAGVTFAIASPSRRRAAASARGANTSAVRYAR